MNSYILTSTLLNVYLGYCSAFPEDGHNLGNKSRLHFCGTIEGTDDVRCEYKRRGVIRSRRSPEEADDDLLNKITIEGLSSIDLTGLSGDPLMLTPYIENGKIAEARKVAAVHPLLENIKSFSGYLTVDQETDANLFFWYFPAEDGPEDAPVLLWLQGGPGTSLIVGVFQSGPFRFAWENEELKLDVNPHRLTKDHHVIYIDNPVEVGYSFLNDTNNICLNDTCVGEHLHEAIVQFFKLFPNLSSNDFFISGESYGCKYAASLGHIVHTTNRQTPNKINLKGLLIPSGFCDPIGLTLGVGSFLYHVGLIDQKAKEEFQDYEKDIAGHVENNRWQSAFKAIDKLLFDTSYPYYNFFTETTGLINAYNYANLTLLPDIERPHSFFKKPEIKKIAHVGSRNFGNIYAHEDLLNPLFMQSSNHLVEELVSSYRVLFVNGQMDMVTPYVVESVTLNKFKSCGALDHELSDRRPWRVSGKLAGYVKTTSRSDCPGSLTEVVVLNAGHYIASDQPEFTKDLISRFTRNNFSQLDRTQKEVSEEVESSVTKAEDPLFLTPLIKEGRMEEALNRSEVTSLMQNIKSYAGYLTDDHDNNIFFWFFPAESSPDTAPLMVWFEGELGYSSLFGVFEENGPFYVDNSNLIKREDYWSRTFHVLYLDIPFGTGYSFSGSPTNQCLDSNCVAESTYEVLNQFLKLHSNLKEREVYLATQSFGCKFVSSLAQIIHKENSESLNKINLKGIAIANGFCDPAATVGILGEYLYQIGIVDSEQKKVVESKASEIIESIKRENWIESFDQYQSLISLSGNENSLFENFTATSNLFNYLHPDDLGTWKARKYVTGEQFRNAIHVGNTPFNHGKGDAETFKMEFMKSVAPTLSELANDYKILFYNGQLDVSVPYVGTVKSILKMDWCGSLDYKLAPRRFLGGNGGLAGYYKTASPFRCNGTLTEVFLGNAGRFPSMDQPKNVKMLMDQLVENLLQGAPQTLEILTSLFLKIMHTTRWH